MPLRVTFDTNTFDKVIRPNVYANDPQHSKFVAIHHAVKSGEVIGFISETKANLSPRATLCGRHRALVPLDHPMHPNHITKRLIANQCIKRKYRSVSTLVS